MPALASTVGLGNSRSISNPKLSLKIPTANIRNTAIRHTKAAINTGGTLFTSTYASLTNCPAPDFTHVRIILKNQEASPPNVSGCIVAVTNTATTFAQKVIPSTGNTVTGDGSTGWVTVTFSGSSTPTLPAAGTDNHNPGILVSDWIPINSLTPVDGSPWPYLMCRLKLSANFTYFNCGNGKATDNTKQDYHESFRFVGDGITTPANFTTPSANDPNSIIFGFEFRTSSPVVPIICVGDSITQGLHTSASADSNDTQTYSWVPQSYETFLSAGVPVNLYNYGYSGATTTQFCTFGKNAVATHKPAVAIYSVFSPNDNSAGATYTQAQIDTMYANAMDFAFTCQSNNCLPVFAFLAPDENLDSASDLLRKALITKVKAKGFYVIDMTEAIGDASTPQKFVSADKYDTLHPNRTGHGAMAAYFLSKLLYILTQNITW